VRLVEEPLVEDSNASYHQQRGGADDVGSEGFIVDILGLDIESEILPCNPPPFSISFHFAFPMHDIQKAKHAASRMKPDP
jgi:hypothetical protein